MLDLSGADAERQRPEGTVRRGVAVAADQRRAGQGEALLGADDVDDTLADVVHVEQLDAELGAVLGQCLNLDAAVLVVDALGAVGGRHVVVGDRQRQVRAAHLAPSGAQPLERLRAGDFVDQVAVDIDQAGAVVLDVDEVAFPDLVEQRPRFGHGFSPP